MSVLRVAIIGILHTLFKVAQLFTQWHEQTIQLRFCHVSQTAIVFNKKLRRYRFEAPVKFTILAFQNFHSLRSKKGLLPKLCVCYLDGCLQPHYLFTGNLQSSLAAFKTFLQTAQAFIFIHRERLYRQQARKFFIISFSSRSRPTTAQQPATGKRQTCHKGKRKYFCQCHKRIWPRTQNDVFFY